jgi:hypothetical protein
MRQVHQWLKRISLAVLLMSTVVIVSGGLGLLTPALSQGQPQGDPCPQAGCPDKPKDDPPTGQQWILVIVHVGAGVPTCDPDNTPVEGAKISFIGKDNKPIPIGSQQPANQSTDTKGRYAAYLALSGPIVEEIKEVKVEKAGFKPSLVTTSVVMPGPLASAYLFVRVCLAATNPSLNLTIAAGPGEQAPNLPEAKDEDSWTCVNLDNDNRDGMFDLDLRQNNVVGENDLVRLTINPPTGGNPNDQVALKVNVKSGDIKLWEDPTKTKQVTLPVSYQARNLPKTLWIEGVVPSKTARGIELELIPVPPFKATSDKVTLTVIGVEEMTWIGQSNSVNGDNKLDANAHPGPDGTVGKRVFPDAPGPNKSALDKVTLRVTLSAPVPAEFKLYLRALDVDDPSSNSAELDPNDTAAKDGTYPDTTITYTLHEDNRGNVGGLKSGQFVAGSGVEVPKAALTDNQGVQYLPATLTFTPNRKIMDVTFTVTKQPGDNFRVLASCDPEFLKDAVNLDKDHKLDIYNAPANQVVSWQSEVLTVWRRLHIERDSMQAPPNRPQACPGGWIVNVNTVCGMITNVAAGAPNNSIVTTDQFLEDLNQYENGLLRLGPAARRFNVLGNAAGPNATVTVQNDAAGAPPSNVPFDLHDDDDDAILPRLPDLDLVQDNDNPKQNLLVWAYVRPTNDGGGGKTDERDFPFDLNTSDKEATDPNYYAPRHQSIGANDEDYWVVYLLSIFQGPLLKDFDPNQQLGFLGLCVLPGNPCGNLSIFYVEQYREWCGGLNPQAGVRSGLQATVVHEIGHSLGGIHSDGGIMASGTQACLKNSLQFTDITLNRIRSTSKPGARLKIVP